MIPELSIDTLGGVSLSKVTDMLNNKFYRQQSSLHTLILRTDSVLNSDATGSITSVFNETPVTSNDWVNLANTFDKYRIIGFRIEYMPNNRYSKTTTNTAPVYVVDDRDDLTPLTAYNQATEYDSCRKLSLDDPWIFTTSSQNGNGLEFRDALSATNFNWIKLFAQNLSVSTAYGRISTAHLVQYQSLGRG